MAKTRQADRPKIVVIGHMAATANAFALPENSRKAAQMVKMYNFTRVATPDSMLVDHIAHLKQERGIPDSEIFSVWEMFLCSGLLLTSHLRRNGFEVKLVNYIDSANEEAEFASIKEFAPDIIALSTTFVLSQKHLGDMGERFRENVPNAFIVAGGHHVFTTLLYLNEQEREQYLLDSGLDAFLSDSQGEAGLLKLCESFPDDIGDVPNLIWRDKDESITHNVAMPENNDINDTLIDFDGIEQGSVVHIRTARSCSFKCAFCSYPTIAGDLAQMTLDNVILTLQKAKKLGAKAIFFVDDTFNVPRDRFEELLDRMIDDGLEMPWYSFLRCQYVDEDLVKKMARSGCKGVFLGIESGSNQMLKNMKKGAIIEFYRDAIGWLRDAGIVTVGSFILGFPGETSETVEDTREFIETSGLEYYFIQPFFYLHHTPIHRRADQWELTGNGLFWSHKTMNWSEAIAHTNRLFLEINNSTFVNPDYTLWEIAYLNMKGMNAREVKSYRQKINQMTKEQMIKFDISKGGVTSRVA